MGCLGAMNLDKMNKEACSVLAMMCLGNLVHARFIDSRWRSCRAIAGTGSPVFSPNDPWRHTGSLRAAFRHPAILPRLSPRGNTIPRHFLEHLSPSRWKNSGLSIEDAKPSHWARNVRQSQWVYRRCGCFSSWLSPQALRSTLLL